ncbi:MAG: hypothetical protein RLZZ28_1086 [Bacteroidota bacterium]|jgi:tRNA threonylcarbamoyladenosine biosynthesis protein TsaB
MALILNIDTATENASVCLNRDEELLGLTESSDQKNHAGFIQPAIEALMKKCACSLQELDAVAVTAGPGSYTGLRVGLASAKGICYALNKPLILINTLKVMAQSILSNHQLSKIPLSGNTELHPMIDARRMEVFTAVYDGQLTELVAPHALILDEKGLDEFPSNRELVFCGSGSGKLKEVLKHPRASFLTITHNAGHLAILSLNAYQSDSFADLAYSEPLYVKPFYQAVKGI